MGVLKYTDLDTTKYRTPNLREESQAKQFAKLRLAYADLLSRKIDDILAETAQKIINVCMSSNIEGKDFTFAYNEDIEDEVNELLGDAEEEILLLIEKYATAIADNNENFVQILLAYLALLGNKNRNLQETLAMYMQRFRDDMEASVAAMLDAEYTQSKAQNAMKSNMHNIMGIPAVAEAMKKPMGFNAQLIIDGGQHYDPADHSKMRGVPTNGVLAVLMMSKIALQMTWDRWQILDFEKKGASGYYQMRNGTYPCNPCDEEVGFHEASTWEAYPAVHPNCQCIRIPIYDL